MIWKNTISVLVLTAVLTSVSPGQSRTITLFHLNDTHSNLAPLGPRHSDLEGTAGGIARAASVIESAKRHGKDVLVLHAGDLFIGDIFFNATFGVAEFKLLHEIGVDAMAVGNHEFDLTPGVLLSTLNDAFGRGGFPLLSANTVLNDPEVRPLRKFIIPYTVKKMDGIKIGIFGLTTPETNMISQPAPAYIDTNFVETAASMVNKLKQMDCSVIILLSHLGFAYDRLVASNVPGIDFIVGGHDHYAFEHPFPAVNPSGDTTYIMQAGAFYENIGKLKFTVRHGKARIVEYNLIRLGESVPEDPVIKMKVEGLEKHIESVYGPIFSRQIGFATTDFPETADSLLAPGSHDTPAGDLVTDAFRAYTNTDIAITAGGSIAEPLHHGPLVGDDIFRLVGYGFNTDNGLGFRLAKFRITGYNLIIGLEFGLSNIEQNDENLIQVSGMTYKYAVNQPPGSRVVDVRIGGENVGFDRIYTVTTNEFVLTVLENFVAPATGLTISDPEVLQGVAEYSVVEGYVESKGTISPAFEGRITAVEAISRSRGQAVTGAPVPKEFDLKQNYPNPFNPATAINYQLPVNSHVMLKVYDVLGREIETLVNEDQKTGWYEIRFDGARLAGGVYFCRLEAQAVHGKKFVSTRKLVLLK